MGLQHALPRPLAWYSHVLLGCMFLGRIVGLEFALVTHGRGTTGNEDDDDEQRHNHDDEQHIVTQEVHHFVKQEVLDADEGGCDAKHRCG